MILGDQFKFQYESLNIEFKEFCLTVDNYILHDFFNIKKITDTGVMTQVDMYNFNKLILDTLEKYIIKYIPRYASAFLNSNIQDPQLYIGIDDYGEITGIPFFGSIDDLKIFIDSINYSKYINKEINIQIEVEELSIDQNYLYDRSDDILDDFFYRINKRNILLNKYKNERIKWNQDLYEYTCKLPMLLKNKKHDFERYLDKHAPHMKNYKIHDHEMRNIEHLKVNPDHYIYWLMKFKDENVAIIKDNKPVKPIIPKMIHGPEYLFCQLTEMRSKLLKNKELNYFLIKIKYEGVYGNNSNDKLNESYYNDDPIYYYNIERKSWFKKYRILTENGRPCCS